MCSNLDKVLDVPFDPMRPIHLKFAVVVAAFAVFMPVYGDSNSTNSTDPVANMVKNYPHIHLTLENSTEKYHNFNNVTASYLSCQDSIFTEQAIQGTIDRNRTSYDDGLFYSGCNVPGILSGNSTRDFTSLENHFRPISNQCSACPESWKISISNSTNSTISSPIVASQQINVVNSTVAVPANTTSSNDTTSSLLQNTTALNETFSQGPTWVKKVFSWYEQGILSEKELSSFVKWMIDNKIMGS